MISRLRLFSLDPRVSYQSAYTATERGGEPLVLERTDNYPKKIKYSPPPFVEAEDLSSRHIALVLDFLKSHLHLNHELDVTHFYTSYAAEALRLVIEAPYLSHSHYTCEVKLKSIFDHFFDVEIVEHILRLSRTSRPLVLYRLLIQYDAQWLVRILLKHNHWNLSQQEATGAEIMDEYGAVISQHNRDYGPVIFDLFNRLTSESRTSLSAEFIRIESSIDARISQLGHSQLKTLGSERRILRSISITPCQPIKVRQLILCHELAHVALWFRKPYLPTGRHRNEEVFCHAAMLLFARSESESINRATLHGEIMKNLAHECLADALSRDAILYAKLTDLLALCSKNSTDEAVSILLESCREF